MEILEELSPYEILEVIREYVKNNADKYSYAVDFEDMNSEERAFIKLLSLQS